MPGRIAVPARAEGREDVVRGDRFEWRVGPQDVDPHLLIRDGGGAFPFRGDEEGVRRGHRDRHRRFVEEIEGQRDVRAGGQLQFLGEDGGVGAAVFGQGDVVADPGREGERAGFFEAFWNRPEPLLDPTVRASQSIWQLLGPGVEERIFERLGADLESGKWDEENGALRKQGSYEGSLRLVISEPA